MTTPAPTPNRMKYDPPKRAEGVPPTMRVAADVGFVRSCPDCLDIVGKLALACIADPTVTSFRAVPGRKHAHEVAEGSQALPGLTDATKGAGEAAEPISDTNGFHPDLVTAHSLNGFDNEGGFQ